MFAAVPQIIADAGAFAAAITAVIACGYGLGRIPPIARTLDDLREAADERREERIDRVVAQRTAPILAELHPNGGSSFRDDFNRLRDDLMDHITDDRRHGG